MKLYTCLKQLACVAILLASVLGAKTQNVIGYMPYWAGAASDIQYTKLTHINYSFAIPDVDGHLKPLQNTSKLQQIVTNAHAVGGKVLIAIGGWSENGVPLDSRFETIGANATYRTNLVNDIVALVNQYNLDGADMDWEFPDAGSSANNFEALMTELYNALHPQGKLVTAAVSGSSWGGAGINSTVKNVVDWLNIMAYDFNDNQHSTYSDALSAVAYYQGKGFPNNQLALGVPFYARPSWESYASIVGRGGDPYQDSFDGNGYNGITTIKQKTNYVINNGLGGVMIWEISQDLTNQYSLVTAIDEEINANGNQRPSVSITSPSNGSSYTEGDNINITASASDADGSVTKVEFYNGATKLGEDLTAPYTFTISNSTVGGYSITAVATDNAGGTSTSAAVSVTVNMDPTACNFGDWKSKSWYNVGDYVVYNNHAWLCVNRNRAKQPGTTSDWSDEGQCGGGAVNQNPTTSITSPSNNAQFDEGTAVNISANASDADGSITSVKFYIDGNLVSTDNSSPYSYTANGLAVGNHTIYSVATDNHGATGQSGTVNITINQVSVGNVAPTVAITQPSNNGSAEEGNNVTISATAADSDGSVSNVEFYIDGVKVGEDNTSPYSYTWNSPAVGNYELTAVATDNEGATTTSSKINYEITAITIGGNICDGVPAWSSKSWYNAGSQCVYNNHLWESVKRHRNQVPPNSNWTDLGVCGAVQQNQAPGVSITSPANGSQFDGGNTISISANATDADGTIAKVEFFANGVKLGEDAVAPYNFNWANASIGSHLLTAVATDNAGASTTSSGVSISVNEVISNQAPSVAITSPSAGQNIDEGTVVVFQANASDADGNVLRVEFYLDGSYLGEDLASPYMNNWTATVGSHSITAIAVDNEGSSTTSTSVNFNIVEVAQNQAPSVTIISPSMGSEFSEGTTVTVEADAVDADGSVAKVEFYLNGSYFGEDLTSPYSLDFANLAVGSHTVAVKSIDNEGAASFLIQTNFTINAQTGGGCTEPQYVEGNTYLSGDDIQNGGNLYDCTVGGWCSGAAWAYEPGVGLYWTEAWTLIRACSETAQLSDIDAQVNNTPTETSIVIESEVAQTVEILVYNTLGQVVLRENVDVENMMLHTLNTNTLNNGIYIIQVKGSSNTLQSVITK